jgi:hypothetical protein
MMRYAVRCEKASEIIEAMRVAYEAEGTEGDFADAARYLRDDVSDEQLQAEYDKWCNKA